MPEKQHQVQPDLPRRPRPEPEEIPLQLVYEDEAIIAVAKPAGIVVHPTYRNWSGTLLNALLWHLRHRPGTRPAIVTRLDRDTSGLVLVALTPEVQDRMQRDMAQRLVSKQYLAVVQGTPEPRAGVISLPLARSATDRRIVVVADDGAPSETRYEVIQAGVRSVVRCELVTGRTHQIRVHLAARGWPIVGDPVYGVPDASIGRQALHALRVRLAHPVSREPLTLEAPLPIDLQPFIDQKLML